MTDMITQDKDIKDLVYVIRGQQVMLDSDLAELYQVETRRLNEAVKRNIERFPERFRFQLIESEYVNLISQLATSNMEESHHHGGRRKLPYVFTEQGISMLSAVLRSSIAIQVSIRTIDIFIEMCHYITENSQLLNNQEMLQISNRLARHEEDISNIKINMATKKDISKIMDNFIDENRIKGIAILNGQKFEAIEAYTKIYKQVNYNIYIIDDYININILSPLKYKKENVDIIIFFDNKGSGSHKLRQHEINVFDAEYPNLTLKRNELAHDRYIIIDYKTDNEKIYHCGASSKDAGKKVCGINEINDGINLHRMIDELLIS